MATKKIVNCLKNSDLHEVHMILYSLFTLANFLYVLILNGKSIISEKLLVHFKAHTKHFFVVIDGFIVTQAFKM